MQRWRKIVLIILCLVLVTSLSLVACKHNKGHTCSQKCPTCGKCLDETCEEDACKPKCDCESAPIDNGYTVYVRSLGGMGLPNIDVSVDVSGKTVSGKTNTKGRFTFEAQPGEYTVTVGALPAGYTLSSDNVYKTSASEMILVIYASSAVIKEAIPSDKIYQEGDVIYDFTITDRTVTPSVTYKLSEALAGKKMVLINFWNTQCGPCMGEMPDLELAYRQYKDDVEVFGISVPLYDIDRLAKVKEVRNAEHTDADGNKFSLTFPLSIDDTDGNNMPYHFQTAEIPLSVVIDRYGVIARIHTGSMDKSGFLSLFEKYTSDNYVQDEGPGGNGEGPGGEEMEWAKPNVAQPDYDMIARSINGAGFSGKWYPDTESDDAEYAWPWLVGQTGDDVYIYPSNHEVNQSFATIKTKLTVAQADIDSPDGKVVLVFDLQWSCENLYDAFYVIVNDMLVYEYTGTEQWGKWQDCYAIVAEEAGDYDVTLMYLKDEDNSLGADTVRIKNVRLMTIGDIAIPSLDMPREAARGWNGSSFTRYINAVADSDGFYHKDTVDGPYVLADLMQTTNFNKRLNTTWSVGQFAVNNFFNYNDNRVDQDDPAYNPDKDDTDAIALWAMAGNNSELYGLTVVNDDLIALLNKFIKSQVGESNFSDDMWLEFCKYFDHFGTDDVDTGINNPNRNPVRGVLDITAVRMVKYHDGAFDDLKDIPDEYKNKVVLTRFIVPRGFKYVITPDKDGVYRFRSQSKELSDTMGWLYPYGSDVPLVATEQQLENPDEGYNFIMTCYLKAGQSYIVAVCFSDLGVTGEFTFTTEYLGESYYAWQYASCFNFTTVDDEMSEIINIMHVQPVLYEGKYYNAKKDAQGNYIKDKDGNYVVNLDDPIYVDFFTGARFFEFGTLQTAVRNATDKTRIYENLYNIFTNVWEVPNTGWDADTRLTEIKGSTVVLDELPVIFEYLVEIYGDDCDISDDSALNKLISPMMTVDGFANLILQYSVNYFDQTHWRPEGEYDIAESRFKDYTDVVLKYYELARANKGRQDRGYADAGSVQLTAELCEALNMFCKRIGGFPELETDWIRLCAHYEYLGPYVDAE